VAVVGGVGLGYVFYKHSQDAALFAEFRKHGDVNGDGVIDAKDLAIMQALFGTTRASPNWNPYADLNGDGKVMVDDILICAQNQGLTYNVWLATRPRTLQLRYRPRGYTVQTTIVPIKEI